MYLPLLLLPLLDFNSVVAADNTNCTEGFMDYQLLVKKSSQISNTNLLGNVQLLNTNNSLRYYTLPNVTFTCNGTITGFLLGVDVRLEYTENPRVFLFDREDIRMSTQINETYPMNQVTIELSEKDFQTNKAIFKYMLSTPLTFAPGQFVGIIQPRMNRARVRFYYRTFPNHVILRVNNRIRHLNRHDEKENAGLLLYPISSNQSCIHGFVSRDEIAQSAAMIGSVYQETDYIDKEVFFKDIRFTCDGTIKTVFFGGIHDQWEPYEPTEMPELLIWHSNALITSILLNYSLIQAVNSSEHLYQYDLPLTVSVQAGDILGIYQPSYTECNYTGTTIYYQEYSGPENYYKNTINEHELISASKNHYPLISLIAVATTRPTSSMSKNSSHISSAPATSVSYSQTTASVSTSSSLTKPIAVVTSTTASTNNVTGSTAAGAGSANVVVIVVSAVVLLMLAVLIAVLVVAVLLKQKLNHNKKSISLNDEGTDDKHVDQASMLSMANPLYEPCTNQHSHACDEALNTKNIYNDLYEMFDHDVNLVPQDDDTCYHKLQFAGSYVPTKAQREKLMNCQEQLYSSLETFKSPISDDHDAHDTKQVQ